jgi:diacylglycerol kinase
MKYLLKFKYAFNGLKFALMESSFRIQCWIAAITVVLGYYYKLTLNEWAIISLCIGAVLVAEIFNTAVEQTLDIFSRGWVLDEIKVIKDLAAAAVLIISTVAVVVGCVIFIPKI